MTDRPSAEPDADEVPRDRLSESQVPLFPLESFAPRLCATVDAVPPEREPYVVDDGLRGALVLGLCRDVGGRNFERHQSASFMRIFMWRFRRVPSEIVGQDFEAHLLRPLVAAMPDAELLVTRLAAFVIDPPGRDPGACTRVLEAELVARRN